MLRRTALISLMAALPLAAQANTTVISLASSNCSGAMSISSLAGASLSCAGNLSLNGGWIDSDSIILIRADGDLLFENINLSAPEISISTISGNLQMASTVNIQTGQNQNNAGGPLQIGPQLVTQDIRWNSFNIGLNQGGNIQFTVPNSSSSVLNRITESGKINVLNITGVLSNASSVNLTTAGLSVVSNQISVSPVPEANTCAMLLLGMGLLALRRKHAR